MKYQIERPVHDFPCHTYRNLDPNAPVNKHLDSSLGSKIADLLNALSEVLIRFDTNPNYYTKEDYFTLIELLRGTLGLFYEELKTAPFNGVLNDITVNPLDVTNPGLYIVSTSGKYENFKDKEEKFIEITDEELKENTIVLNPKYNEEDSIWYYEKILIPAITSLYLKSIIGKDKITLETYYTIKTSDDVIYYTKLPYEPNTTIEVYNNLDFTGDVIPARCTSSNSVIINNIYGIFDITPLFTATDLLATEKAVFNAIQEIKNNSSVIVKEWGINSNVNDYTATGLYHFVGYRLNENDNLPISNLGEKANVAFTLLVDQHQGKFIEPSTNVESVVSQTLFLGNRQGSETKIYTRQGQLDGRLVLNENAANIEWESWSEVVTSRLLENVDINTGLNDTTEIGLYTGYTVTGEVFKLEVINNYAAAEEASKQIGTTIPNHVLQTITVLSIDGSEKTLKRTGIYNGNGYTWNDWKSIDEDVQVDEITIEETMDDLITLDFIDVIQNGDDIITDENNLILTI